MLNSCVYIGRIATDPELKYGQSGKARCTFRLAVDRGTNNAQGERVTDFFSVVVFDRQAEAVSNHKQKGDLVAVQGQTHINQFTAQDGQKREKVEVVCSNVRFLDKPKDGGIGTNITPDDDIPY